MYDVHVASRLCDLMCLRVPEFIKESDQLLGYVTESWKRFPYFKGEDHEKYRRIHNWYGTPVVGPLWLRLATAFEVKGGTATM